MELLFSWWRRKAKIVLVADIWKALLIIVCQQIWVERNRRRYDNQRNTPMQVMQRCIAEIADCSIAKGIQIKSVNDLMLAKFFKVDTATPKLKQNLEIRWKAPPVGWWKLNIDGSSIGNPGYSGAGGIFRNHLGVTRRCFSIFQGIGTNFQAKMAAFSIGINEVKDLEVERLWVECDSATVVTGILSSKIPWDFLQRWWTAENYLKSIQWRITHCYREGNATVDALANRVANSKTSENWNGSPNFIAHTTTWEALGRPYYRLSKPVVRLLRS
ncbi:uncharacterized protein LOC122650507 [Telopea speciosissima]|uniref:uncharacterized protein LOC122650507 n=1 Tax=Telopea speciosissima TaxID=54955 RepID=UPI001CC6CBD5|nr:uncharacterized protein LOC122650507 [Telopea speciosissima]